MALDAVNGANLAMILSDIILVTKMANANVSTGGRIQSITVTNVSVSIIFSVLFGIDPWPRAYIIRTLGDHPLSLIEVKSGNPLVLDWNHLHLPYLAINLDYYFTLVSINLICNPFYGHLN